MQYEIKVFIFVYVFLFVDVRVNAIYSITTSSKLICVSLYL